MIPLLNKLAETSGLPLRDLEMKWRECRAAVIEKGGADAAGTYEYVRVVLEFAKRTELSFQDLSL